MKTEITRLNEEESPPPREQGKTTSPNTAPHDKAKTSTSRGVRKTVVFKKNFVQDQKVKRKNVWRLCKTPEELLFVIQAEFPFSLIF